MAAEERSCARSQVRIDAPDRGVGRPL